MGDAAVFADVFWSDGHSEPVNISHSDINVADTAGALEVVSGLSPGSRPKVRATAQASPLCLHGELAPMVSWDMCDDTSISSIQEARLPVLLALPSPTEVSSLFL